MATTAITPTPLVTNVVSADLQDAGIVADTPADGWVIAAPVAPDTDLMLMFLGDAGGDATVTVLQGDRPPSQRSGLGDLAPFALAAIDLKFLIVEKSRFLQDDGTIHVTCVDSGTKLLALTIPKIQ